MENDRIRYNIIKNNIIVGTESSEKKRTEQMTIYDAIINRSPGGKKTIFLLINF